jgi:hypothetical protein
MPIKLKSIKAEAEACKKAWEGMKVGTRAVHCHHEVMTEELTEVAINRINYILTDKPLKEQALRLRLFRPVKGQAWKTYEDIKGQALKTYEDIEGQAWKTYEDIKGQAWKTYKDIEGQAWKTYKDIEGPAWKTYEDIEGPALKTYEDIKGPAHKLICKEKNCSWNGKTIFP